MTPDEARKIIHRVFRRSPAYQRARHHLHHNDRSDKDSPIEAMMNFALHFLNNLAVEECRAKIEQQAQFEGRRADFRISLVCDPRFFCAVECNGNEYHSAPRALDIDAAFIVREQERGVPVLPFTGPQIDADAFGCASAVFRVLVNARRRMRAGDDATQILEIIIEEIAGLRRAEKTITEAEQLHQAAMENMDNVDRLQEKVETQLSHLKRIVAVISDIDECKVCGKDLRPFFAGPD